MSELQPPRPAPLVLALLIAGCTGLLDVSDPTAVEESDIDNPAGVELLRRHAITEMYEAVSYGALYTGLISDELFAFPSMSSLQSGRAWDRHAVDLRSYGPLQEGWSTFGGLPYEPLQGTRIAADHAINWYRSYGMEWQLPQIGEVFAVRGYATLALAEQVCPGFPLHRVKDNRPIYGPPLTTEEAFEHALADLDTAVAYAADSSRILHFAQVVRGRTLLGMGRFEDAAASVTAVPTTFVLNGEYGGYPAKLNWLARMRFRITSNNFSIADHDGANGLNFVSADDPRVPVTWLGTAHDGATDIYATAKYPASDSPITIASGIEARLIEAEAALRMGSEEWLELLNELRTMHISPALDPLADPGSDAARVDLLFRERAFWLFATGHRLGDLRRLVRHYSRSAEDVFPVGAHATGDSYGTMTSIPFLPVGEERANTGVTGCTEG